MQPESVATIFREYQLIRIILSSLMFSVWPS